MIDGAKKRPKGADKMLLIMKAEEEQDVPN